MNSRVFHWKNQQWPHPKKNIGIFPGGMDDSEYPPANARCNLADSGAIGDLKPALCWPLNWFFRPQGASWSIRLQPVLFRCGCTQHALGVPWADWKLVFDHIVIARHCVHPVGWCNVNILHKQIPQQHPSAGFIPTAWKEAKTATAASTWGLLADVSCKPRHSGHSEHSAFH